MQRLLLAGVLCALSVIVAAPVRAQGLPPETTARLVLQDSLLDFRTRPIAGGRWDAAAGVQRAAYQIATRVAPGATPEAAARAYLADAAPRFGWAAQASDLHVTAVETTPYSSHVVLQQTFQGLPVYQRQVKVSVDRTGQPTMAVSAYAPHLQHVRGFDARPTLSAAAATARAQQLVTSGRIETSVPRLVVYPTKQPRLAWHLIGWPHAGGAEWSILVDAHTGELIQLLEQGTHAHHPAAGTPTPPAASARFHPAAPAPAAATRADGSGLVFDPDPLTTAGVPYGGAYADAEDADVPALNDQRVPAALREITQGTDGLYRLEGPYVHIDGSAAIGGTPYTPPAEPDPHGFRYTRADDRFEAVMVYYHIDKSQRYLQTLDLGRGIQGAPLHTNPHGYGMSDNSRYYPSRNVIAFGTGGIDDGEDASVIWHEYAHALLQGSAPGLLSTTEGQALHEGWADYWAASYTRDQIERGAVPARDWQEVFYWDGNYGVWCGRRLDHPGHYPDAMAYASSSPDCAALPEVYQQGLLWATTLMEIYPEVGRTVLDRLNLASHAYLAASATFRDAAEALIQADRDLHGGAYSSVLVRHLGARGFIDPSRYGPVLAHTPLPATEALGSTVTIEVDASGKTAPVDSVVLYYGIDAAPSRRRVLTPQGDGRYAAPLTLPATPATVSYYLEAVDTHRQYTRLPADAPDTTFHFHVGPDAEPPRILHNPLTNVSLPGWPLQITADVDDDLGVDSVWVDYLVEDPDGTVQAEGAFGLDLVAPYYQGLVPVPASKVQEGSIVRYRLHARDAAAAGNEAVLPADGRFAVGVVAEGILQVFSFDGAEPALQATGRWQRGTPAYGLQVAHSGRNTWSTTLTGPYPAGAQLSSLSLPSFNLRGLSRPYLTFWHWFDLEHNGHAEPDRLHSGAVLWDGGNLKVSTDGGQTWTLLQPEGGYNGTVASDFNNPLAGEQAFGGYSYGWRRVVVPLPTAADVRVRFDFGSDDDNTDHSAFGFAGWYLDDLTLTTRYPEDTAPPVAATQPPAVSVRSAGQGLPPIVVQLTDDTGIAAVEAVYEVEAAAGMEAGRQRLAMVPTDLSTFAGTLDLDAALDTGDRVTYRLYVRDFAGHEVVLPAPTEPPFLIEYRLTQRTNALAHVRASGLWQQADAVWTLAPGTAADRRSSLVLEPFDLPTNSNTLQLILQHRYRLDAGAGGNVKVSVDDGRTWTPLAPEHGYPDTLRTGAGHPMEAEGVFSGTAETTSSFDLAAYAGRQVRLRVDFGSGRALADDEFWTLEAATLSLSTRAETFETPRTLALHPNFPDPFAGSTTISYTIPELLPVRLSVYDLLGRRVAVLVHAEQPPGTYTVTFDGGRLAGGVYLLYLEAGGTRRTEQMVIVR